MNNKNTVITCQLEKLKISYYNQPDKKWQISALNKAIDNLNKYEHTITSGEEVQKEIKGIGKKIALYINEILEGGTIKELEKKDVQEQSYNDFMNIVGVGKAKANEWISKDIYTIDQLKEKVEQKTISLTDNIKLGLKYYEDLKIRIPRKHIDTLKKSMHQILQKIDKELMFEICGSYRRKQSNSGDIDFLISHPKYNMALNSDNIKYNYLKKIVQELKVKNIIVDEMTKNSTKKFLGMCKISGYTPICRIDIMFIEYPSYYSSIMYFTGNKYFNLYIRNKCLEKNYSLNEYYLKNIINDEKIYLKDEKHIFEILQIPYLNPENRNFLNIKK